MPKIRHKTRLKYLTVKKIASMLGVCERTLQYWIETQLIKPSIYTKKRGSPILLSYWNLLEIAVVHDLRIKGCSLQGVRKAVQYIRRSTGHEIWERKLFITEKDIFDCGPLTKANSEEKTKIISLIKNQGQMFFIDLVEIRKKVNKEIRKEKVEVSLI